MEGKEKFLPIGTVVLLKGGKRELMITCYCIIPTGDLYDKNGKVDNPNKQLFDYGACFYPEGIVNNDQTFAFNHSQIDKICYMGYETEKQKELSKVMNANYSVMQEGTKIANERLAKARAEKA